MLNYTLLDTQLEYRMPYEKRAIFAKNFTLNSANRNHDRLVAAMQPIDAEYTEKTFADAESVKTKLWIYLPARFQVEFDYQGSVTSNTHIRLYSDIDLLAFHGAFVLKDYAGLTQGGSGINVLQELSELRNAAAVTLRNHFSTCTIDSNPGKSIAISGSPLARKVDVVIGNWWDTVEYQQSKAKSDRGINILNSRVPETLKNKPFDHNRKLDEKDNKTGGARKSIRLLKTLKYSSSPELAISSYDIAALVWNMYDFQLTVAENAYATLAQNVLEELKRFIDNQYVRDAMMVPNGTRKVFGQGGASLEGLKTLHSALETLLAGTQKQASFSAKSFQGLGMPLYWRETLPGKIRMHSF